MGGLDEAERSRLLEEYIQAEVERRFRMLEINVNEGKHDGIHNQYYPNY